MRKPFFLFLILFPIISFAQLTIVINSIPVYTPENSDIYLSGDLNSWNPAHEDYKFSKPNDSTWQLIIPEMDHGRVIQFKFTRGSWETVEKGANGEEIMDRHYTFGNGGTINPTILNWADNGSGGGGSTAAENVSIIDDSFYMPQLDRNRRIWIYLPPNYENSGLNYPVMYMHDGQNIFDSQTSFAGEWEVDETLNDLYSQGIQVPIVVGIDNGGTYRIDEYTPWINPQYGGGQGGLYMDFIVETLKPFIDETYRTKPEREYTAIMGSSLGGLISQYGSLKFQNVFSMAGLFSPAYWIVDELWDFTTSNPKIFDTRFYQMCGGLEGDDYIAQMELMHTTLQSIGFTDEELFTKVIAGGQHNEQLWRNDFENAYKWLFKDYLGSIYSYPDSKRLQISPNPTKNNIHLNNYILGSNDSIQIYNLMGVSVLSKRPLKSTSISVFDLPAGVYTIIITNDNNKFTGQFVKN